MKTLKLISLAFLLVSLLPAYATETSEDPLNSPSWALMHQTVLNNEAFIFDERVSVALPSLAEDPMNVPVTVRVDGLEDIKEIVVFADLNPIHKVLVFRPVHIKPTISFRFKVEQSTPVRAAVKTADGIWHVGGTWLEAAGGGCTAPSSGAVAANWHETLMNVSSRNWKNEDASGRLRIRIMHPMDTGLAAGIPEFYIKHFEVLDNADVLLARLETYQPISENPIFTLDYYKDSSTPFRLLGADNNGNRLNTSILE